MGNEVFKSVVQATGLPGDLVEKELETLLIKRGLNSEELSLEDLRATLSEYLKEVILKAKDTFDQGIEIEEEILPEDF
jgi:hypothetical protein